MLRDRQRRRARTELRSAHRRAVFRLRRYFPGRARAPRAPPSQREGGGGEWEKTIRSSPGGRDEAAKVKAGLGWSAARAAGQPRTGPVAKASGPEPERGRSVPAKRSGAVRAALRRRRSAPCCSVTIPGPPSGPQASPRKREFWGAPRGACPPGPPEAAPARSCGGFCREAADSRRCGGFSRLRYDHERR